MPWRATNAERERLRFIAKAEEGLYGLSELCERFGISRQTGYTLLQRYEREGVAALQERSRAPRHSPQRIPEPMQGILLDVRRAHPDWGPRTVLGYLARRQPELVLPAASTVGDLYLRQGLVEPRPRRRRWRHPGRAAVEASAPNEVWTTDFKGQFRTGDGRLCYPLTIADAHTRFLLACDGLSSTEHRGARAVFERVFRSYGLPAVIRSDNGSPFCTQAIAGLSRLSVWWTQLGIGHDRIERGHPEQNGSHERMHRTLKQGTLRPVAADGAEQQQRFDAFRAGFNEERPHHALQMQTPGSLYTRSVRELPARISAPEYPAHLRVRQLRRNGILYFRDREMFVSELLMGELVGLEEIDDGVWSLYYYDLLLARLDERTWSLSS
jgi:putative transposase